jgi:hypothetical protein
VSADRDSKYRAGAAAEGGLQFGSVPLPAAERGMCMADNLESALWAWASSLPIRALAEASGWEWPTIADVAKLLKWLEGQSSDWNFRARRERNYIGSDAAYVNGREIPEDLIVESARALGMVEQKSRLTWPFSAIVVLCGTVGACVNRIYKAASLVSESSHSESVVILTAHRRLQESELETARALGLTEVQDEARAAVAITREAFHLGDPEHGAIVEAAESDDELWSASAWLHWRGTDVYVAPSSEPGRRANTADQLRYWADLADVGPTDRLLLVTTQIYAPFQQLIAARILGLERGCNISCVGVDSATAHLPFQPFSGRLYLQEIRSAIRAAAELIQAARGS